MIIIPTSKLHNYRQSITIEGVDYIIDFIWNSRCNYFTASFYDSNETPIIQGIKLLLNFDLLRRYSKINLPRGYALVIRNSENRGKIEFEEIGTDCILSYLTEAEYEAV